MIRVNLVGAARKKSAKKGGGRSLALPTSVTPIILLLIVLGAAAGGYFWYTSLSNRIVELDGNIASAQAQKAALDAVIKQNQVFEGRKKALENRIKIIEELKRNQVNPVLALDVLSEAIEKTQYVWLSELSQSNAILSMSGTGTSLNAISDFVRNLDQTGYFKNPDLANATDAAGNFTFNLKVEFAPPVPKPAETTPATAAPEAAPKGGN